MKSANRIYNSWAISKSREVFLCHFSLPKFPRVCLTLRFNPRCPPPPSVSPSEPACLSPSFLRAVCLRWCCSRKIKSYWLWWAGSCSSTSSSWTKSSKCTQSIILSSGSRGDEEQRLWFNSERWSDSVFYLYVGWLNYWKQLTELYNLNAVCSILVSKAR